ncbi:methylmalonyl-CoA mutase family protein [Bacillus massiliglaciei]|uniref:methylmalonyl-CoA mutase family protein n=1 Tax=Bacillus massiliglaciei TaxID=1816693 RepID=UPI000DA634D9|nr:methylmalonyl-CoA mutase family protein [Bacillus massiliglaciei]
MELKDVRNISFPKPAYEEWADAVRAGMKGKNTAQLKTSTYENITLQPLYISTDMKHSELPGFFPYTRGIFTAGYQEIPWLVCQPVQGATAGEASQNMQSALNRGQNCISCPVELWAEGAEIEKLTGGLPLDQLPFFMDLKGQQSDFMKELYQLAPDIHGVLAEDPIAEWLAAGKMPKDGIGYFSRWMEKLSGYSKAFPSLKTVLIKTQVYHNAGANAVQEIAFGLSAAARYLEAGLEKGMDAGDIAGLMVFSFAVSSDYFMNIAKLRAARRLWAAMAEAYEADPERFKMHIHGITSEAEGTVCDPHVNILRTANQAFAAAVGGVQSLEILPFDHTIGTASDTSERIARNIHLILKEEAHLTKVADPAGGSYYVEKLTNELAEQAWTKFLEIDQAGGILHLIQTGRLQKEINEIQKERVRNAACRKESIIGTNVYPNPEEKLPFDQNKPQKLPLEINEATAIEPLKLKRTAEPFEILRNRSQNYQRKTGQPPKTGLINLNDIQSSKPRADFIKGMLAAGGVHPIESKGCHTAEEAADFAKETGLLAYILCGSDGSCRAFGEDAVNEIKRHFPDTPVYMAGLQAEDWIGRLKKAGLEGFIHKETNAVELLERLLRQLGVSEYE